MEEQFQTVMESEDETKWLPVQILDAVYWTPNLPDDQQVEVMKVRFAHSLLFYRILLYFYFFKSKMLQDNPLVFQVPASHIVYGCEKILFSYHN